MLQKLSQPSPERLFPSSHCSGVMAVPSPQMLTPETMVLSSWQVELQPSPEKVLPSSHCPQGERKGYRVEAGTGEEEENSEI